MIKFHISIPKGSLDCNSFDKKLFIFYSQIINTGFTSLGYYIDAFINSSFFIYPF